MQRVVRFVRLFLAVLVALCALPKLASAQVRAAHTTDIVLQLGHTHAVTTLAFSPDGRHVVSGSRDRTIKLWDATSGILLRTFAEDISENTSVAFSPDGKLIASGSWDTRVRLWDAATGVPVRTFDDRPLWGRWLPQFWLVWLGFREFERSTPVAFSPDGRLLAAGDGDVGIKLWDAATGELARIFEGHSDLVSSVTFSPDGRLLASGSDDNTIRVWDAATGALRHTFAVQSTVPNAVKFSPDGRYVMSPSEWRVISLWDLTTGQTVTLKGAAGIDAAVFSPDGRFVVIGSSDQSSYLWDAATGVQVRRFEANNGVVSSVAVSPDGRLVASGTNSVVKLWDAATGAPVRTLGGHRVAVDSVGFSPDGRQMLWGEGKRARLWDAATGALVRSFEGNTGWVTSVVFSPDGRQVLSGASHYFPPGGDAVKLWDATTGKLSRTFEGHVEDTETVAFSPDGRQVMADGLDSAKLWNAQTGSLVRTLEGLKGALAFSVALSPDGRTIASRAPRGIELWDVATGSRLRTIARSSEWLDWTEELWGGLDRVHKVVFSPDGQHVLAAGGDDAPRLWSVDTGVLERTFAPAGYSRVGNVLWGDAGEIMSIAFSPDGRLVAAGNNNGALRVWDAATGELAQTFVAHSGLVGSVAISPDGRRLLSAGSDGTVKLWTIETGDLLATFFGSPTSEWLVMTPEGFFNASSPNAAPLLGIVRGLDAYGIDQMWQSLYAPDLVREKLAGDPSGEVARAAAVAGLDKVLDSGKAPKVAITSPASAAASASEIITAEAAVAAQEGGIGRVEWRVNGITVGVSNPAPGTGPAITVKQTLSLDPGDNTIEIVAYNGRNLLASLPAESKVTWTGTVTAKPKLHLLSIGINRYVDKGGVGATGHNRFPPLGLAVADALAVAGALERAGYTLYGGIRIRTVTDEEATLPNLEAVVTEMAAEIEPRDTFVLFAAAHGYSHQGRFYLIPQDYQGGTDPQALATRAIDQLKLQDWIANRIKAKRALVLLDSCEAGALTSGHSRSRFDGPTSDAAIGRLHEAIGRPVLTAAGLGQSAIEINELGHGVFTSALIDSFYRGDANGDGVVGVSELVAHVQDVVPRLIADPQTRAEVTRRGPIGGAQSARFGGRGEDFALVHRIR